MLWGTSCLILQSDEWMSRVVVWLSVLGLGRDRHAEHGIIINELFLKLFGGRGTTALKG